MEEKKNNKIVIIFCLIFLIIVLIGAGFFIYKMTYKDNLVEDKSEEEKLLYKLDIYKGESGQLCLEYNENYCKDLAFSIPTKEDNAKAIAFDIDNLFVLYSDNNELKIYNHETNKSKSITLENNYKKYSIYKSNDKKSISGIVYTTNDDKSGYFNVKSGNKLYEEKYGDYELFQINDDYLSASKEKEVYLLNSKSESEELSYKETSEISPPMYFHSYEYENKYIFTLISGVDSTIIKKIYSNDKKEIYSNEITEEKISYYNGALYLSDNNLIKKIDFDGNISDVRSYKDVKGLINNYVVYVNNNKLILENIDSKDSKELTSWNKNYFYDYFTSKYYTREELDKMSETAKIEGLYVVITYPSKDNNGYYGMEYCLTSDKEIKTYPITQEVGGRAKPVLYLYPTKTMNVKVEFQYPEYLTTTYPKYIDSWNVTAHPNGDLYDNLGKYYYALYWDEVRYNEVDFNEGFYVEKENAIEFLEDKLDIIGLNKKEKNEFIMYWLPILENNEKSIVYFELTKERESGNKLIVTPKPDSMLRISIHIKKVKDKVNIREQKLESFNRVGFSVVEWGGMTY